MLVFRKNWCAWFSCPTRFEIHPFALLLTNFGSLGYTEQGEWCKFTEYHNMLQSVRNILFLLKVIVASSNLVALCKNRFYRKLARVTEKMIFRILWKNLG